VVAKIIQIAPVYDVVACSMVLHGLDADGTTYVLNGTQWEVLIVSPK
jgi:hypothetical protein